MVIGDDCSIGHNTVLATLNHDLPPSRRADMHPAPIVIGRNVWIGSNVTVLPGVTIGDDASVAAASVVTKDEPEKSVVVGVAGTSGALTGRLRPGLTTGSSDAVGGG